MSTYQLLTTVEAAAYLKVKPQTLRAWRADSSGPPYFLLSSRHARYATIDLEAWLVNRKRRSTSSGGGVR